MDGWMDGCFGWMDRIGKLYLPMVILIKRLQNITLLFYTKAVQKITTYVLKYIYKFTSIYLINKSYKLSVLQKVNREIERF